MKRVLSLCLIAVALSGCKGGPFGDDDPEKKQQFHIVACCRDNNAGIMTYPSFLPASHVQLCEQVRAANRNDATINGDMYIAVGVDCERDGYVGSEYYKGRGY